MIECTELLMLIQTFWGSQFQSQNQKITFSDTIIGNLKQSRKENIINSSPSNMIKRLQHLKNNLINITFSIIPKFILTCELYQMV